MFCGSTCVCDSRRKSDTILASTCTPVVLQHERQEMKVMGHMLPLGPLKGEVYFLSTSFLTQERILLCRVT